MIRLIILTLLGCALVMTSAHKVHADPQVLAALPVGGPLEFLCGDTTCEVEFSAICLQPDRHLPQPGTAYKVLKGDLSSIVLSGYSPSGQVISLSTDIVKVASRRGQTAIQFSVAKQALRQRGLSSVSIGFDRPVALVPQPSQDDSEPQTQTEIAKAASDIRRFGKLWADGNANNMAIARIIIRMANQLPASQPVANASSNRLLQLAADREAGMSEQALKSTQNLVTLCQRRSQFTAMRKCLVDFHDQIMRGLNGRYWSILNLGS